MRALRLLAVAALAGTVLVAGPGPDARAGQTGPVVASQDAYVISTAVRTTYDTTELRVRNTPAQKLQAYLTFDLRGVPSGATGLRATLRLTASPASQSGRVEVRTSGGFSEQSVTWARRPATSAVQGSAAVARGATVTWTPPAGPVSDRLVPREGAWWGSYPGQAPGDVEAREAVYGRRVDVLHRYHDWDDVWPTPEEQAYAAGGRILFEGWENRVFGGTTSCWADVAAGAFDAAIDAQARRLADFGERLFVGFMHEPEDNAGPCQPGAVDDAKADMGSVEDFRAAFRHVVERVRPVAPNVVWVFSVMGHDPAASWAFYPGDDVVDWVAWDPYNWANCAGRTRGSWRGFAQVAHGMYAHLDAVGNTKPRMLGEYGSHDDPAMGDKAQWLRDVPAALRTTLPKVRAVVYFDRLATPVPGDPCAWLADSSPDARAGFAAGVSDSYLNQPHN
jgi:hypothetical protein